MSDIKLFRLTGGQSTELQGEAADLEKPLQLTRRYSPPSTHCSR
jgi:hypothetical protein